MPEHPLDPIRKADPAFFDHLTATNTLVLSDGAIPRKYKLLMAMAFDAAHGAAEGVKALARQALQAGATKEEVMEALRVACYLGGVGSAYTAAGALAELL